MEEHDTLLVFSYHAIIMIQQYDQASTKFMGGSCFCSQGRRNIIWILYALFSHSRNSQSGSSYFMPECTGGFHWCLGLSIFPYLAKYTKLLTIVLSFKILFMNPIVYAYYFHFQECGRLAAMPVLESGYGHGFKLQDTRQVISVPCISIISHLKWWAIIVVGGGGEIYVTDKRGE